MQGLSDESHKIPRRRYPVSQSTYRNTIIHTIFAHILPGPQQPHKPVAPELAVQHLGGEVQVRY